VTRLAQGRQPAGAGPRGSGPSRRGPLGGAPVAAALSLVGLVVVALVTLAVGSGDLPLPVGGNPGASGGPANPGGVKTPTPSNIIVVPSDVPQSVTVPGMLVYAKAGNIWLQSAGRATQLTSGGTDSMPSFTPDGQSVLFVRTRSVIGNWNVGSGWANYTMDVPAVMEVPTAGGTPTKILDGLYNPAGRGKWMAWIREPVLSPDGRTLAILTDLPNPTKGDVILKLFDLQTRKLTDPRVAEVPPLGHQDPAWRPDGKVLAYVYNNRSGANGAPQIFGYTPATGRARAISGPGYLHPSWSPDGRYLAVTKTSPYGTDVSILNASTGAEVLLVTRDGASWAPAWSPAGDEIAFLHVSGQVVDLRLATLTGSPGAWEVGDTVDLTQDAGLDSISRPGWFVPPDQLPAPTPAASAATGLPSAPSAGGSAAP